MTMLKYLFILIIFSILLSCTRTDNRKNPSQVYVDFIESNKLQAIDKISVFKFVAWNALDNSHLVVTSSPKQSYLLTLNFYCPDLSITSQIVIDQINNNSLSAKFDAIIVPRNSLIKCTINNIHVINKEQRNALGACPRI